MGEDLQINFTRGQRTQWINYINSYAGEDGIYRSRRHSVQHHNGMAISALGALGGKQIYLVKFYEDFNRC